MAKPYLSIIIPAYNEAERIPKTLLDMDRRLSSASYSYEIIVVNDGSKDNTAEVVTAMAKMVKNLELIDNKENKGKGGAVKQGILAASGNIRLFTDSDLSTSIDQFEKMMPFFQKKDDSASGSISVGGGNYYDVVIGSRAIKGARLEPPEPLYRQFAGKGLNLIVQLLLLPGIWDTQCGFKAFTEEAAEKIFGISRITKWGFDVEALALAKRMGYRIKEIPVHWVDEPGSTVHLSAGFEFLRDIIVIRWRLWTNGYTI